MTKFTRLAVPAFSAALALAVSMPAQARDTGSGYHGKPPTSHGIGHGIGHGTGHGDEHGSSRNLRDFHPVAVPATRFGAHNIRAGIDVLQRDIERAAVRRTISWREAASLRSDAHALERLYWSYSRGGLSRWEATTLDRRLSNLRVALHIDMNDRDRRRG